MPEISVILPVYNGAKTLDACVASVLKQSCKNFEFIAIDDGSNDDSFAVLSRYEKLKIVRQENAGVSATRNRGGKLAEGDYLAFIDQDDVWEPNKLECQLNIAKQNNSQFVFCNFKRFDHNNSKHFLTNSQLNNYIYSWPSTKILQDDHAIIFSPDDIFRLLVRGYPIYPSTMFISKELFKISGGWSVNYPRCQDFDISLKCSQFVDFCYIDKVLTGIGRHDTNVSGRFVDQLAEDLLVLQNQLLCEGLKEGRKKVIKYYIGKRLCWLGKHYRNLGDYKSARTCYLRAMTFTSGIINALIGVLSTYIPFNKLC